LCIERQLLVGSTRWTTFRRCRAYGSGDDGTRRVGAARLSRFVAMAGQSRCIWIPGRQRRGPDHRRGEREQRGWAADGATGGTLDAIPRLILASGLELYCFWL